MPKGVLGAFAPGKTHEEALVGTIGAGELRSVLAWAQRRRDFVAEASRPQTGTLEAPRAFVSLPVQSAICSS